VFPSEDTEVIFSVFE